MNATLLATFYQIYTAMCKIALVELDFDMGEAPQELFPTVLDIAASQSFVPPPELARLHQDMVRVINDWLMIVGLSCTDTPTAEITAYRWGNLRARPHAPTQVGTGAISVRTGCHVDAVI